MYFAIQICNPIIQVPLEKQVEYLEEALENIFSEDTEDAYFLWNWIPIRVSYKYDLSVIIEDILILLDDLLSSDQGSHEVYWGSNSFRGEWKINWSEGQIQIVSKWDNIAGNYEDLLNERNYLQIDYEKFLFEWKALLKIVIDSINKTNIKILNQDSIDYLLKIEAGIPNFSSRYSR